jgi:hypothetical protein
MRRTIRRRARVLIGFWLLAVGVGLVANVTGVRYTGGEQPSGVDVAAERLSSAHRPAFVPLSREETELLSACESPALAAVKAGNFRPEFERLSAAERQDLQESESQDLHGMRAGDLEDEITVPVWALVIAALAVILIIVIVA